MKSHPMHAIDIAAAVRHGHDRNLTCRPMPSLLAALMLCLFLFLPGCSILETGSMDASEQGDQASVTLPEGWTVYMPESEFSCVFCYDGMILAGGLNGLYLMRDGETGFSEILHGKKPFRSAKSLYLDDSGRLWVGHEKGVTCIPGFRAAVSVGLPPPIQGADLTSCSDVRLEMVNGLMSDGRGVLYAGTFKGALRIPLKDVPGWLDSGDTRAFGWLTEKDGLTSPMVNTMLTDSRGFRWFGAYIAKGGGVAVFLDDAVQTFNHENGLADDYVTTIAEAPDGSVWVGSGVYMTGGATRFGLRSGRFVPEQKLTIEDGLAGDKVRFIYIDEAGNRWFCSEYDGIAVFDPEGERVRLLTEADGLPDNEVKRMAENGRDDLWLACRRGVLRLNRAAVSAVLSGPG